MGGGESVDNLLELFLLKFNRPLNIVQYCRISLKRTLQLEILRFWELFSYFCDGQQFPHLKWSY